MKTAFLFPGQGAQTPGMGSDLYLSYSRYREAFDRCEAGAGLDLKAACFKGEGMEGSDVIQPAIYTHSVATLCQLESEGVTPDYLAGLSLGEYAALTAAGVMDEAQGASLVRRRGSLMDGAVPPGTGGMLSVVGLTLEQVESAIEGRDAHHITAPQPEGKQAARAMAEAIRDAGITKEQIGYINAHGTSTPLNDATESVAIESCFGEHAKELLVSSTKSMTGHMLGAAGAFEAVLSLLALNEGVAPPTIGLIEEDEVCRLNYVKGKAQKLKSDYALSNSFGFGGHNSCLVLRRGEG